ncbi:MAG: hypothetical protein R3D89_11495 [Sphingomonadaceae bacterium]|jgi:hypothetical protein
MAQWRKSGGDEATIRGKPRSLRRKINRFGRSRIVHLSTLPMSGYDKTVAFCGDVIWKLV